MPDQSLGLNETPIKFNIYTRQWNEEKHDWEPSALKASRDPDGRLRLRGTASSTVRDLHGDNMLQTALEDMERAANNNLTIFGNHSYDVPEDVYGSVEHARMKAAGTTDDKNDPIWDLDFDVVVNEENDRAVKTWRAIDKGTKLGMSIGAMIPPGGAMRDKKSGALTISHVELLETSIVGIPANPRSWIENAVKAYNAPVEKAAATLSVGTPQLTLDTETGHYTIEGSIADLTGGESISFGFGKTAEPEIAMQPPEVADAATCPDCGHGRGDGGGCKNPYHSKGVDPDVTDAKIRVIEIDTGDDSGAASSQGASNSQPDDDGEDSDEFASAEDALSSAESVMASLDPEVTSLFQRLVEVTQGLNRELALSIEREREANAAKVYAERQRDEIALQAASVMENATAILNKLADQPVGRRAVFREAQGEFASLEGIYSSDFLSLLRSTK